MFPCVVLLPQWLNSKPHLSIVEKDRFVSSSASPLPQTSVLFYDSLIYLCTHFFPFALVGAKTALSTWCSVWLLDTGLSPWPTSVLQAQVRKRRCGLSMIDDGPWRPCGPSTCTGAAEEQIKNWSLWRFTLHAFNANKNISDLLTFYKKLVQNKTHPLTIGNVFYN